MKTNIELRELTVEELHKELLDSRKRQFQLRLQRANGSVEKTHFFAILRKYVARLKTILTEKVG